MAVATRYLSQHKCRSAADRGSRSVAANTRRCRQPVVSAGSANITRDPHVAASLEFARMSLFAQPCSGLPEFQRIKDLVRRLGEAGRTLRRDPRASSSAKAACLLRWRLGGTDPTKALPNWAAFVAHWVRLYAFFRRSEQAIALVQSLPRHDRALFSTLGRAMATFKCLEGIVVTRFQVTHLGMCISLLQKAVRSLENEPERMSRDVTSFSTDLDRAGLGPSSTDLELKRFLSDVDPRTVAAWFLNSRTSYAHEAVIDLPPIETETVGLCVALCQGDTRCLGMRQSGSALCDRHRPPRKLVFGSCEEVATPLHLQNLTHFASKTNLQLRLNCFNNPRTRDTRSEFPRSTVTARLLGLDKHARPIMSLSVVGPPGKKRRLDPA